MCPERTAAEIGTRCYWPWFEVRVDHRVAPTTIKVLEELRLTLPHAQRELKILKGKERVMS